jgi:hypothetical protein
VVDTSISPTVGCRIGDSPIQYFNSSGYATGDWLMMRMVPNDTFTGITFYLYNQGTPGSITPIFIPYAAQSTTVTGNTTALYAGFGIITDEVTEVNIYADYMGLQLSYPRIYP